MGTAFGHKIPGLCMCDFFWDLELVACLMGIDRGWGCRGRVAGFSGRGLIWLRL
jgi:hypothetical protein